MNEQSVSAKGRLNDVSTFAKIIYALPGYPIVQWKLLITRFKSSFLLMMLE